LIPSLILASNSPRRKQLLALGGWEYEVVSCEVDETPEPGELPAAYVQRLAVSKARAAAEMIQVEQMESLIIAADTTVVDAGQILGKPQDGVEAAHMLRQLRGHTHQVYTAITLLRPADGALLNDACCTDVPMRVYTQAEIETYVASGDPLDKAGAYAIQNRAFHPVQALTGCYANVVGLPLCHLSRSLRRMGVESLTDLPAACQVALEYACPVYRQILGGN
jgi:septum formation protein